MVESVRAMPEYRELLEILREMIVDREHIIKLLKELFLQGNVFNNCVTGIPCVLYSHA
jgi:hypothetical protein